MATKLAIETETKVYLNLNVDGNQMYLPLSRLNEILNNIPADVLAAAIAKAILPGVR